MFAFRYLKYALYSIDGPEPEKYFAAHTVSPFYEFKNQYEMQMSPLVKHVDEV